MGARLPPQALSWHLFCIGCRGVSEVAVMMNMEPAWIEGLIALTAIGSIALGIRLHRAESAKEVGVEDLGAEADPLRLPTAAKAAAPVERETPDPQPPPTMEKLRALEDDLAILRGDLSQMNAQIRNLQHRESMFLEALQAPEAEEPDELIELAQQGLSAAELMQHGELSGAEAELLRSIHGASRRTH